MYDFSGSLGSDLQADGRFGYEDLDDYWRDEALHPFLFQVDSKLAGFALVQHVSVVSGDSGIWDMEEFFVMPKYRRLGVATRVMRHLWNEFSGKWEIRVLGGNDQGLRFWTHAIRLQCNAEILPTTMLVGGKPFDVFEFRL